jgi:Histidine kinase/Histidine kinase-, DNA gyrase B-, and HSP90-like ATPase
MELRHIRLIGFAVGVLIVGLQTALIAKQWRRARGIERRRILECGLFCLITVLWQLGNLVDETDLALNVAPNTAIFKVTFFTKRIALSLIPLSLSYLSPLFAGHSRGTEWLSRFGRWLRFALWPWSVMLLSFQVAWLFGWISDPRFMTYSSRSSVRLIPVFFVIFTIQSYRQMRESITSKQSQLKKANVVALITCLAGIAAIVGADWLDSSVYVRLAVMATLTIFAIAVAYRQYHFPFMDTFLRHATPGVLLLAVLVGGVAAGLKWGHPNVLPLWFVALSISLMYIKEPFARWVERAVMGFDESIESQEDRIGMAVRGLIHREQFSDWVSEVIPPEMGAHWSQFDSERRADAVAAFEVPGSEPMWLSLGPRIDGRAYMSRQLRLGQTTALQLAAQYERVIREEFARQQLVSEHELRELTSRAQIRALQAQIRPHFLFNTLNVLSNLIHTDPRKAEDLTEELASVFRYTLDATRTEWVSLEDELRFVTSYLRIEKARFEGRLGYLIDMEPQTETVRIPPMILQPVVENAVRHGIASRIEGGVVRLSASLSAGQLVLIVEDSGSGLKTEENPDRRGIGLKNVRDRLKHIYRDEAILRLSALQPTGTRVTLTLPEFSDCMGTYAKEVHV